MNFLQSKSYVASLCYGAFIQTKIEFGDGLTILPLKPIYEEGFVNYVAVTCTDFKIPVDLDSLTKLHDQIKGSRPCTALIKTSDENFKTPEDLEIELENSIYKLKLVTSFISGDPLIEFARLMKTNNSNYFRMIPQYSRKRQKLFFSKEEGTNFFSNALKVSMIQEYYLSLLHDANHEKNPLFAIARYYGVLEAIANNYKQDDHKGSKDNIRFMLNGIKSKSRIIKGQTGDTSYELDTIEIAYRIRNKFFHGGEPIFEDFKDLMPKMIWDELAKGSNTLISSLQSSCEIQLMKEINKNSA